MSITRTVFINWAENLRLLWRRTRWARPETWPDTKQHVTNYSESQFRAGTWTREDRKHHTISVFWDLVQGEKKDSTASTFMWQNGWYHNRFYNCLIKQFTSRLHARQKEQTGDSMQSKGVKRVKKNQIKHVWTAKVQKWQDGGGGAGS